MKHYDNHNHERVKGLEETVNKVKEFLEFGRQITPPLTKIQIKQLQILRPALYKDYLIKKSKLN